MREQVFVTDKAMLAVEYGAGSLSLRVVDVQAPGWYCGFERFLVS